MDYISFPILLVILITTPPWILKRGGLESYGQRLISSMGKSKRIVNSVTFSSKLCKLLRLPLEITKNRKNSKNFKKSKNSKKSKKSKKNKKNTKNPKKNKKSKKIQKIHKKPKKIRKLEKMVKKSENLKKSQKIPKKHFFLKILKSLKIFFLL